MNTPIQKHPLVVAAESAFSSHEVRYDVDRAFNQGVKAAVEALEEALTAKALIPAFADDAEALKVLDNSDYIECNNNSDKPYWAPHGMNEGGPSIILDGSFTRLELLAILHFHPKE
jgi:hypothetical protein